VNAPRSHKRPSRISRHCEYCGCTLVRKEDERAHHFVARRFCGRECWNASRREQDPSERIKRGIEIDSNTGCWNWQGDKTSNGYGRVRINGRKILTHVLSYQLKHGPMPEGKELHHRCENRACCNPNHVEPVTRLEHCLSLSRRSPAFINARKTHCKRGHEFTAENTWLAKDGERGCRQCMRAQRKRWHEMHPGPGRAIGERHHRHKLSEAQVRLIKMLPRQYSHVEIAKALDMSPSLISAIRRGRSWKHIQVSLGGPRLYIRPSCSLALQLRRLGGG
jgi:hypothetical protein